MVEATYNPVYWLHHDVPAKATFGKLDPVLRDLWLECSGHISAFQSPRETHPPNIAREFRPNVYRPGGVRL